MVIDIDFDYNFDDSTVSGFQSESTTDDHEIFLTEPQTQFLQNKAKFPLFVAGFGAGKSTTLGLSVLNDLNHSYSGIKIGIYCPTYDLLKLITIPYLEEFLYHAGIEYKLNKQDNIFYLDTGDQIIMRSMDNPARIVGYQTFRAHIDEMDTLVETKAEDAWNKIIARNRQPIPIVDHNGNYKYIEHKKLPKEEQELRKPDRVLMGDKFLKVRPGDGAHCLELEFNRVSAYSTPEGFRFCYNRWAKDIKKSRAKGYEMIQAPTYSNPYLKPDYIQSLRDTYPAQLIDAYLEGKFVNLTSGAVYPDFDRKLNHTDEIVRDGDVLHVGMDFNVGNMSAAIFVIRNSIPYLVDEIAGGRDTPSICTALKERYVGHQILVYPDSSGQNTSSKSASQSDLTILRSNGFMVKAKSKNPFIKDRVASVCAKICNANGARAFFVNTEKCPTSVENLEQQVYGKDSAPDKKAGKDHMCFSGDTLVMTPNGNIKIKDLPKTGKIINPLGGVSDYHSCGVIKRDQITVSIVFDDLSVVRCTPDHKFLMSDYKWEQAKNLKGKKCLLLATQNKSFLRRCIINAVNIFKETARGCTGLFGHIIMEKLKRGIIYIIKMKIKTLMILKTFKNLMVKNIFPYIITRKSIKTDYVHSVENINIKQKNGMGLKRELSGTKNITKKQKKSLRKKICMFALLAIKNLKHLQTRFFGSIDIVQKTANQQGGENRVLMTSKEHVAYVMMNSRSINTQQEKTVLSVDQNILEDVYCLTVEDTGSFVLSNKVIVSNCDAIGYLLYYLYPIVKKSMKRKTATFHRR